MLRLHVLAEDPVSGAAYGPSNFNLKESQESPNSSERDDHTNLNLRAAAAYQQLGFDFVEAA
jgi:hypothetical protein